MADLKLTLLGGFEATLPSGTALALPTRKAQALLAYCALHPTQTQQREKLATLLWGETDDANARNSLRQTLFVLRSALGRNWSRILDIARDSIRAEPLGLEVDALSFERLAGEGTPESLERAAALYKGDLLDGFIVDEDPFEEWLFRERERLRDLAMDTLARLLQHQRAHGPITSAIHTARSLLALDPLQEVVHRLLMRLLVDIGRRDEALNQYEACSRVLKRELNVEPEAETTKLRAAILDGLRSSAPDRDGDSVRHRPLTQISDLDVERRRRVHGEDGWSPASPDERAKGELDPLQLQRDLRPTVVEARRLRTQSREGRLLLRRAFQENARHVMAFKRIVLEQVALGAATEGVADLA